MSAWPNFSPLRERARWAGALPECRPQGAGSVGDTVLREAVRQPRPRRPPAPHLHHDHPPQAGLARWAQKDFQTPLCPARWTWATSRRDPRRPVGDAALMKAVTRSQGTAVSVRKVREGV